LVVCLLFYSNQKSYAQEADTLYTKDIQGITIFEKSIKKELRSATPLQTLNSKELETLNVLQLSDAVKFFSGATIKDYGGIGGLKTVSVRSLGAAHTMISYDGISVTDFQTGQVDLGRFSLNNVDKISLSAGQEDDIFQPARLFSSAAVLNITTSAPKFADNKKIHTKISLKAGSFAFWNPQLNFESKLNELFALSINAEYLTSKGNYPYTLYYGTSQQDSSSREVRENSEIETFHADVNLFGNFRNNSKLHIKSYYYQSERGLPGATILYYNHSRQRLFDRIFFTQAHYKQILSKKISFQVNGKFNWSYQHYLNPDYLGNSGTQENNYYQTESYLSGAMLYNPWKNFSFSLASDISHNIMQADLPSFAFPERIAWLTVLAGKYNNRFMTLSASLLATVVNEKVSYKKETYQGINYGKKAPNSQKLTPALSVVFRPFKSEELSLRSMYKEIFRMPSFNDLYYSRVGNPDLKPEYTWQYNAGIIWGRKILEWLPWISLTADFYYNKVNNKIIAIPTKNIFEWSMQNIGKVNIYGIDLTLGAKFQIAENYLFSFSGTYTFQRAIDVTSDTDPMYKKLYGHQIPYTPEHSASGRFSAENPYVNFAYTLLYSGSRYSLGQNIPENRLAPYIDQTFSIYRRFHIGKITLNGSFEILNLLDQQYEIVRYFPMPGRSFRIQCSIQF
jgi:outer membrane cobalamin receptor